MEEAAGRFLHGHFTLPPSGGLRHDSFAVTVTPSLKESCSKGKKKTETDEDVPWCSFSCTSAVWALLVPLSFRLVKSRPVIKAMNH